MPPCRASGSRAIVKPMQKAYLGAVALVVGVTWIVSCGGSAGTDLLEPGGSSGGVGGGGTTTGGGGGPSGGGGGGGGIGTDGGGGGGGGGGTSVDGGTDASDAGPCSKCTDSEYCDTVNNKCAPCADFSRFEWGAVTQL